MHEQDSVASLDEQAEQPLRAEVFSREKLQGLSAKEVSWYVARAAPNVISFSEGSISQPEHVEGLNLFLESGTYLNSFTLNGAFTGRAKSSFKKLLDRLLTTKHRVLRELSLQNEISIDAVVCKDINTWLRSREGLVFKFTGTLSEEDFNLLFADNESNLKFTCLKLGEVAIRTLFFTKLASLSELSLNNTDMDNNVWSEFCDFISQNDTLESLTIARILYNKEDRAKSLGKALGENKNLTDINIIHERRKIVVELVGNIKGNSSLKHFSYNSLHDEKDTSGDDVVSALTGLLEEARARLTSIKIAGTFLPVELVSCLNKNVISNNSDVQAGIENIRQGLNQDSTISSLEFKSLVHGPGSSIFFGLLPKNSRSIELDLNLRVASNYDSLLLRKKRLLLNRTNQYSSVRQLFPVDVCSSTQQNAYSVFSKLYSKPTNEVEPLASVTQGGLIDFFAENGVYLSYDAEAAKQTVKVNNCWFGMKSTDIGTPLLRSEHEGKVCFVTFMVGDLLSVEYSREMKKITTLVAKALDSQIVFLVGIVDQQVVPEVATSLGIDLLSLKRFLSQEIMEMLPLKLHKRLGQRVFVDRYERSEAENSVFFVDTPFDDTLSDCQGPLWRSVEEQVNEKEVISRWYLLLSVLKQTAPYIWHSEIGAISSEVMGVKDLDQSIAHFEHSGELLVLRGKEGLPLSNGDDHLVVLDRSWLNGHMEDLCSDEVNVKSLWPGENKDIQIMLLEYAKLNGLIFEIGSGKTRFLPYVVPKPAKKNENAPAKAKNPSEEAQNPSTEAEKPSAKPEEPSAGMQESAAQAQEPSAEAEESSAAGLQPSTTAKGISAKARDMSCLFSISIPHHYCDLEFFNIFCGNLLKYVFSDKAKLDEKKLVRSSEYLEFSFDENRKVWANCDSWNRRIRLGLVEEKFDFLYSYVETCRIALQKTVSFFIPNLGDQLFDINQEDSRTIEQYPHLLLHFVVDEEIMKVPYEAFSGEGAPIEFGLFRLPVRTIEQIDFIQTAKEIVSKQAVEPEMADVLIISSYSEGPNPRLKDLLGWLLRHQGYRVEFETFPKKGFPKVKSKVLVMFLGREITTSLENEGKRWKQEVDFKGWPMDRCFFMYSSEGLTPRCNNLLMGCRRLDEKAGTVLKTLVTDVSKRVDEIH